MLWTPIQHINETILKKMGRPVNFESFYNAMCKITNDFSDIFTSTDIILGFPGETQEIFQEVIDFFKKDKCFKRVYHFGYSDMKGIKIVFFR
jgi:ribosomal protein S12 methylthiotransferase